MKKTSKYSNFVTYAKKLCLLGITIMFVFLLIIPIYKPALKQLDFSNHDQEILNDSLRNTLKIEKLRFFTLSKKFGPYFFTVDHILRNKDYTELINLSGFSEIIAGINLKLQADKGYVYASNEKLRLLGNVKIVYEDNNSLSSELLFLEIKNLKLSSPNVVTITKDKNFILNAKNGFQGQLTTKKFFFNGPIEAKYYIPQTQETVFIKSKNFNIDDFHKKAEFNENIELLYKDTILCSDSMAYDYRVKAKEGNRIILQGNIKFNDGKQSIVSDHGIFDINYKILKLHKNVIITKGATVIRGENFIYSFEDDKGEILGASEELKKNLNDKVKANIIIRTND